MPTRRSLYPHMLATAPGHNATVLVAFAFMAAGNRVITATRPNLLQAPIITISAAKNPILLPTENSPALCSILRNRL